MELCNHTYFVMRNYMKQQQQSALTHIDAPAINDTWKIILVLCCFAEIVLPMMYKHAFYTSVWIYT
eukprot:8169866-Ditylum_brightwellii.AAC.1